MSNPSITADKKPWYQWDTGLTVTVSGGEMTECHFANRKQGTAYVQAVINGIARVPDELLQVAAPIKAYGYVSDGAGGQTYVEQTFDVIARNIPADYTYTKTAQKTIRDAEAARDQAVQAANDAKASELAADDSAVEASNSAQSAGESASAAATSASNSAKSAGDASKSASDAKAAASKTVEDASELLKTYTDNAKTSADNAATSASNAADSASAASGSASTAEQRATDASNAKVAAQTAKDEAATSASNAATSASNAESSATAAAKSASDAAASVDAINVIAPKKVSNGAAVSNRDGLAIGAGASVVNDGVAVGFGATSEQWESVAVGFNSSATGYGAIAIGKNASVAENNSVAIGNESTALSTREFSVGNSSFTREITNVNTPTAPTSASTKKYTDDNDTKTLSDAKKYTDANTSNALVGKVSGKLMHVEDAWPGKPLGLTIDGAYKQDGTPSPENPVPIEVIEHPVLWVTGRNMLDPYKMANTGTYYQNLNGEIRLIGGDSRKWETVPEYGVLPAGSYYIGCDSIEVRRAVDNTSLAYSTDGTEQTFKLDTATPVKIKVGVGHPDSQYPYVTHVMLLASSGNDVAYAPYVGTSIPITLPAEHPYLAALPDGTHDEIVIDKDGNASLVARVGKSGINVKSALSSTLQFGQDGTSNYLLSGEVPGMLIQNGGVGVCNAFKNGDLTKNRNTIRFGASNDLIYIYHLIEELNSGVEAAQRWMDDHGVYVIYPLVTPITYNLGKLDIPALPETISNVWIDAELTTNMSMTYKRDINIAFDNLVQSVVAAAAGE